MPGFTSFAYRLKGRTAFSSNYRLLPDCLVEIVILGASAHTGFLFCSRGTAVDCVIGIARVQPQKHSAVGERMCFQVASSYCHLGMRFMVLSKDRPAPECNDHHHAVAEGLSHLFQAASITLDQKIQPRSHRPDQTCCGSWPIWKDHARRTETQEHAKRCERIVKKGSQCQGFSTRHRQLYETANLEQQ